MQTMRTMQHERDEQDGQAAAEVNREEGSAVSGPDRQGTPEQRHEQAGEAGGSGDRPNVSSSLLTVNEAARYLRVSRTTLYRLIDRSQIAIVRLSADPRFLRGDLDAFIQSKREAQSSVVAY